MHHQKFAIARVQSLAREATALPSRNPNCLGVCKFANSGSAELAAKPGTFHTAERQSWIGGDHCIYENHPCVQVRREEFLFFGIVGPCAGGETECGIVCQLNRVGRVAHAENRCDRPEHLFSVGWRFFRYIDENSWLVEKSGAMNSIAARQ